MKNILGALFKRKKKYVGPPFYGGLSIEALADGFAREVETDLDNGIALEQAQQRPVHFLKAVELDLTKALNFDIHMGQIFIAQKKAELADIKNRYTEFVSLELANTPDDVRQRIDQLSADLAKLQNEEASLKSFCNTLNIRNNEAD